jgi:uncharacterized DUF497 family protein
MRFKWDESKNRKLKKERGVSFEMVLQAMEEGRILDILEHPNADKYQGQRLYLIEIDNYVYVVPYEDKGDERVLKTVFPSRRYTRLYVGREEE